MAIRADNQMNWSGLSVHACSEHQVWQNTCKQVIIIILIILILKYIVILIIGFSFTCDCLKASCKIFQPVAMCGNAKINRRLLSCASYTVNSPIILFDGCVIIINYFLTLFAHIYLFIFILALALEFARCPYRILQINYVDVDDDVDAWTIGGTPHILCLTLASRYPVLTSVHCENRAFSDLSPVVSQSAY